MKTAVTSDISRSVSTLGTSGNGGTTAAVRARVQSEGQLMATNGVIQMAQNDQSSTRTPVIALQNAEPQDAQQLLHDLFPNGSTTGRETSVQNNPLMQRAQTVQQNQEAISAMSGDTSKTDQMVLRTNMISLKNADAVEMSQLLHDLFPSSTSNQFSPRKSSTVPVVSASVDPETGKLIVITDDKTYSNITNLVAQLDSTTQSSLHAIAVPKPALVKVEDRPEPRVVAPALIPQSEVLARENAFSTFSLNVSDVSFKLAAASLEKGQMPDAASDAQRGIHQRLRLSRPRTAARRADGVSRPNARVIRSRTTAICCGSPSRPRRRGAQPGRALNIVLLLDNSGSMERADRVAIIHEALRVLASQLQPQDTLSVVTFARTARLWVDGMPAATRRTRWRKSSELTPEGGTNLEEAMRLAYETALRHYLANGMNRVVLLTDGAANLGNVDPEMLKQKVESHRKQGIALDCFGIGWEGYNDDLLEVLSQQRRRPLWFHQHAGGGGDGICRATRGRVATWRRRT